jgi:hypothetical protein
MSSATTVRTLNPQVLSLPAADRTFLTETARNILGTSNVAATTASGMIDHGIDAKRVDSLLPWASVAVEVDGYVFKKVEADVEVPHNFGLFVRRRAQ